MPTLTTPPAPLRLQLALQGGGARIVPMLAAMEAVQALQRQGGITVTRVAGTSAGAIVAAMFAAGIDLADARRSLIRTAGDVNVLFPRPSLRKLLWRLLWHQLPLWDQRDMAGIIEPIFANARVRTLRDLHKASGTHVHIVASDLSSGRKVTYSTDDPKDAEMLVVPALLDSCAIPYCFRVWPKFVSPVVVDGGICENLPSDDLLAHQSDDGIVAALGFETAWHGCPLNVLEFSMALLDTAMSNSIARAKARLGERVHSIRTDVKTFDFPEAAALHDDTAFRIAAETTSFLERLAETQQLAPTPKQDLPGDPWAELSVPTMECLWKIYSSQHSAQKSEYEHCSLVVHAHSAIVDTRDELYGAPDFVIYRLRFKPLQTSYCSRLSMIPHEGTVSLASSQVAVRDEHGRAVDFVLLPARDPEVSAKRPAIIFFTPPLPAESGPYTLELQQRVPGFMKELTEKGTSEMFYVPKGADRTVGRIDLVLHIPAQLTSARMSQQGDCPGRPMTDNELSSYGVEPGFRRLGWCAENVPAGMKFAANVSL